MASLLARIRSRDAAGCRALPSGATAWQARGFRRRAIWTHASGELCDRIRTEMAARGRSRLPTISRRERCVRAVEDAACRCCAGEICLTHRAFEALCASLMSFSPWDLNAAGYPLLRIVVNGP